MATRPIVIFSVAVALMSCGARVTNNPPKKKQSTEQLPKSSPPKPLGNIVRFDDCDFSYSMEIEQMHERAKGSCNNQKTSLTLNEACAVASALSKFEPFWDTPIRIQNFPDPDSNEAGELAYRENLKLQGAGYKTRLWIDQDGAIRLWTIERTRNFCLVPIENGAFALHEDLSTG